MVEALDSGKLHSYVCDFPTNANKDHPRIVALPHLGASTEEAEENCAIMVADTLREFLEHGNVRNSVNFPEAVLPRANGGQRLAIANDNVPNMVGQISTCLAAARLNIADLLNKSRGELAYTLVDTDAPLSTEMFDEDSRNRRRAVGARALKRRPACQRRRPPKSAAEPDPAPALSDIRRAIDGIDTRSTS